MRGILLIGVGLLFTASGCEDAIEMPNPTGGATASSASSGSGGSGGGEASSSNATTGSTSASSSSVAATSGTGGAPPVICPPKATFACDCAGGGRGLSRCSDDGTELGSCVCGGTSGGATSSASSSSSSASSSSSTGGACVPMPQADACLAVGGPGGVFVGLVKDGCGGVWPCGASIDHDGLNGLCVHPNQSLVSHTKIEQTVGCTGPVTNSVGSDLVWVYCCSPP